MLKDMLIIALNTGMRQGNIRKLKWSDIDNDNDLIQLPKTKSGEGHTVPMNKVVKQCFERRMRDSEYIFSDGKEPISKMWLWRQ